MTTRLSNSIQIYKTDDQSIEVRLDGKQQTLWFTQAQMAEPVDVKPQNITHYLNLSIQNKHLSSRQGIRISYACKQTETARKHE